ncbi:DNA-protecting protein DprA [Candidatus Parcubacteria bacterium]|nr:DNA-protecting protein DprA [Candidatus Parcubacteria bacterium]
MSNLDKKYPLATMLPADFPLLLKEINDPPKKLYIRGTLPPLKDAEGFETKFLCVVGSRAFTSYGEGACRKLILGLRGYNICIVSGLALGIDGIAHRAALEAGLLTIAIPGSGLDPRVLYPRANVHLAEKILEGGGAIISEEEPMSHATPYSFPKRNRIMAGMSHAVLVIEAILKSGTLITSKYATDYNRDVFTVPGSIFSRKSDGPHMLIRLGATPVRTSEDILEGLGFEPKNEDEEDGKNNSDGGGRNSADRKEILRQKTLALCTSDERAVIETLTEPMTRDALIRELEIRLDKPISEINALLVMMEIKELVVEKMGEIWVI